MRIAEKIAHLQEEVARAASQAGRDPAQIQIVLVTKTVEPERIMEAYEAGVRDFGENRAQELLEKKEKLPPDIRWHMIGRLQTNKTRQVAGETALIHSLDRPELAEEIGRQAKKKGINKIPCLVQVNASGEASKFGVAPGDAETFAAAILANSFVDVRGLMAIGPNTEDVEKIRQAFRAVKNLRSALQEKFPHWKWNTLSMGMSGDYKIAIEEGSTLVRIGTAVFGERNKK